MIDSQTIQAIGLALLHFTWQGLLVGAVFTAVRLVMPGASAVARYNWAVLCLAFLALAPLLTFAWLISGSAGGVENGIAAVSESLQVNATVAPAASSDWIPSSLLPVIVGLWLCGVVSMSARLGAGWWYVRRLRRHAELDIPPRLQMQFEHLSAQLDMARTVGLAFSSRIAGPMLVGVFRPLILLPVGLANRLSTRELEMVLAHELAHLRRADHIVNLFQNVVETLLFYHPVVRWISNVIRAERELACDEQAALLTGDRITYAETLLKLERARGYRPQLAIGMADHQLLTRVRHLLAPQPQQPGSMISGMAALMVILISLAAALASTGLQALSDDEPAGRLEPAAATEVADAPAATGPVVEPDLLDLSEAEPAAQPFAGNTDRRTADSDGQPEAADRSSDRQSGSEPAVASESTEPVQAQAAADSGPASLAAADEEPSGDQARSGEARPESEPERQVPTELAMAALTEAPRVAEARPEAPRPAPLEPVSEPRISGGSVLEQFAPDYPRGARRQGREGRAEVRLTVNSDGRVVDAVIVEEFPRGYGFGEAAVEAAEKWRFEPFTRNGEAIVHDIRTGFDFTDPPPCERVTGSRIARC